jgi:Domain of unknown function (DUF4386)
VNEHLDDLPKHTIARVAGLFYLIYIVTFASSTSIQNKSVIWRNAGTTDNVVASERLFRVGFTSELIAAMFFLLAAWALYVLLKPVNKNFALLFLLLNLAGVAVECGNTLIHFAALLLAHGSDYSKAFTPAQMNALAMLFLKLSGSGDMITTLFYGLWLFPLGYLVIKSGFIPRFLGVLLVLDGCSLMVCFVQLCLFPGHEKLTYPLYPIMFVAEFGLSLWLLVKGVKDQKFIPVESKTT